MARYGWTFSWTEKNGDSAAVTVRDYPTAESAFYAAKESAIRSGWTLPKWWQVWRWRDQPRSSSFSADQ